MKSFLIAIFFIGAAVVASPVDIEQQVVASPVDTEQVVVDQAGVADHSKESKVGKDAAQGDEKGDADEADVEDTAIAAQDTSVSQLMDDLTKLRTSASDVIHQVEATLSNLESFIPHSIRKRQTTVDLEVNRGQGGPSGRVDINHRGGRTNYHGHYSRGQGRRSFGAGVSHRSRNLNFSARYGRQNGSSNFGASVSRSSRRGSWGVDYQRGRGGSNISGSYGRTWNNGRTSLNGHVSRSSRGGTSGGITFRHRL